LCWQDWGRVNITKKTENSNFWETYRRAKNIYLIMGAMILATSAYICSMAYYQGNIFHEEQKRKIRESSKCKLEITADISIQDYLDNEGREFNPRLLKRELMKNVPVFMTPATDIFGYIPYRTELAIGSVGEFYDLDNDGYINFLEKMACRK
jgi:hypothetical protein